MVPNLSNHFRALLTKRSQQLRSTTAFKQHQSNPASRLRVERVTSKLPKSLQKYTSGLRNAPVSHVVAFLILHELTAIVPLFALFGLFHYTSYVPVAYMTTHFGDYVQTGVKRFERYFSKKGWFGFGYEDIEGNDKAEAVGGAAHESSAQGDVMRKLETGEQKYQILVEVALAYAITKVLLPVRIMWSVWATPWFATKMVTIQSRFTRKSQ